MLRAPWSPFAQRRVGGAVLPHVSAPRASALRSAVLRAAAVGAIGTVVLSGCATGGDANGAAPAPSSTPRASASPTSSPSPEATPDPLGEKPKSFFDRDALSVDDPASIWVVTNKLRPLVPANFVPPDLTIADVPYQSNPEMRAEAATALAEMFEVATAEGAGTLQVQNAYRSFDLQTSVHDRLVAQLGVERARAQSARPGFSEHQTGLSVDIMAASGTCSIQACFAETTEGAWLAQNAWRFGFILRYPADKTPVTGYVFEPWHYRYVGLELATEMRERGITTLEEFFGLPAAPDYAPE